MMRDNWEQVKKRPQLGYTMGSCDIIQGDARDLYPLMPYRYGSEMKDGPFKPRWNYQVDKIITSPPFAGADQSGTKHGVMNKNRQDLIKYSYIKEQHGETEGQIGNLPYGEIDKCIFSPPYAEQMHETGSDEFKAKKAEYAEKHLGGASRTSLIMQHSGEQKSPNNIAKLPYGQIDKIVTSPPYEAAVSASTGGERDMSSARQREKRLKDKGYDPVRYQGGVGRNCEVDFQYTKDKDNIGNLKSDSYLEAMLQVYQQCHKVLKPEGLMILVTKNFIRNKQVVRLDTDTIQLCEQAGFSFVERHYRELPSQSFWRVIYHQKFPDVEQIKNEDVLVFVK